SARRSWPRSSPRWSSGRPAASWPLRPVTSAPTAAAPGTRRASPAPRTAPLPTERAPVTVEHDGHGALARLARPTGRAFDQAKFERVVRLLLEGIGEDLDRDGLRDTPARVARMYEEITSGLREDSTQVLEAGFEADHDEMIMIRDIPMASICEHHLIPFIGKAHVAYIPNSEGRITGLSKLARLVDGRARRPQ